MELKPGYKQTEVGVIPEDWEVDKLGNHARFKTGPFGSSLHKSDYVSDGIPVINPMQIVHGQLIPTPTMAISEHAAQKLSDFRLAVNDVVIGRRGEMGRCAVVQHDQQGWLCGTGSMIVRAKETLNECFIQRLLSSPPFVATIENSSVGTTMINLNHGTLSNLCIPLPKQSEQSAIATVLSDADGLIGSLEQLIAKKRHLKQAAMQQLLTGKKRLPGFSGEWEPTPMNKLGDTYGGLTGKKKSDFGAGNARYITFMNVMNNVMIDNSQFEKVRVANTEAQNKARMGDLFFNGSSETPEEVGMCSVLSDEIENLYLNSFCFGFRLHDQNEVNGTYLAYYFRSEQGRELVKSLAQGATRYNLSKTALKKLFFPLPNPNEQTAIAEILSDMDSELAALEAKLAKARQLKQALMQQLLTGKIRLI